MTVNVMPAFSDGLTPGVARFTDVGSATLAVAVFRDSYTAEETVHL